MVVGAGIAGTAAALAAARSGAQVVLIDGGTGASSLATGALDFVAWENAAAPPVPIATDVQATLGALAGYLLPSAGAKLLTTSGVARRARGHDAALLDVEGLRDARVGVVDCRRPGWDAAALSRSWGNDYAPVEAVVVRHLDEHAFPDADFAAAHDDAARLGWLAERLREALARTGERIGGLVLPPCLGVEHARAQALSKLVGVACGEAVGLPGGPSGLRFERARDRALASAGVQRRRARASGLTRDGHASWQVRDDEGAIADCYAVILACGGLIGGGIEYCPAEAVVASALPPFARPPFRLTIEAPVTLGAHGAPLQMPSSLFGDTLEDVSWPFAREPLIDRLGIVTDDEGRAAPGIYAAGEARADRPRTWLDALQTGATAGAAAARDAAT